MSRGVALMAWRKSALESQHRCCEGLEVVFDSPGDVPVIRVEVPMGEPIAHAGDVGGLRGSGWRRWHRGCPEASPRRGGSQRNCVGKSFVSHPGLQAADRREVDLDLEDALQGAL